MNQNRKTKKNLIWLLAIAGVLLTANKNTRADFVFSAAERLEPPINSPNPSDYEWLPRVHLDGLSITVHRNFDEESERWVYTRPTKHDPWDTGIRKDTLPNELKKGGNIMPGWTTMDGLELYVWFISSWGYGDMDIYVRARESIDIPFSESEPVNIGPVVNTQYSEALASVSPDGLELYFSDYGHPRPGGSGGEDLWMTRRATRDTLWNEPVNLGLQVNSPANDSRPHISADGLLLFFDSNRAEGYGGKADLYMTRRKSLSDPWGEAVNLGPNVNGLGREFYPCISPDGRELFFVLDQDIWQTSINPVVDLNDDGIVDAADMCIIVNNWGTDEPLCDIGPMPWGDGVVDIQDLIVLAEHLFEETTPVE